MHIDFHSHLPVSFMVIACIKKCINCRRFIRTTSPKHVHVAKEVFRRASQAGDVYLDTYQGWYNTREETFVPDGMCALI